MANVEVWGRWWQEGPKVELDRGIFYKDVHYTGVHCFRVPAGKKIEMIENKDGTGRQYPAIYGPCYFPEWWRLGEINPGQLRITDTGLTEKDMLYAGWDIEWSGGHKITPEFALPPGYHELIHEFDLNDKFIYVRVPSWSHVDLWDSGDGPDSDGAHIELTGNNPDHFEYYTLSDFDFSNRISAYKLMPDGWIVIGIEIDQNTVKISEFEDVAPSQTGLFFEHTNNTPHQDTFIPELDCRYNKMDDNSFDLEAGGSVTASAEIEVECGPVEVGAGLSVEAHVSATRGESHGTEDERTFSISGEFPVDPGETLRGSVIAKYGQAEGIAYQVMKNKRTGAEIRRKGRFKVAKGLSARLEVH